MIHYSVSDIVRSYVESLFFNSVCICNSRHVINVTLNEDTAYHSAGSLVNALVYSGSISNPNFHFILDGTELRDDQTAKKSLAGNSSLHKFKTNFQFCILKDCNDFSFCTIFIRSRGVAYDNRIRNRNRDLYPSKRHS
jgi:hypothetical protein